MRTRPNGSRCVLFILGSAVLSALACGDDGGPQPCPSSKNPIASVTVTASPATIEALGATTQLTATAKTASGAQCDPVTFSWSSSAQNIVTVNASGVATAVANGTATIIATADGRSGSVSVQVAQRVATVNVTPPSATIAAGATQQFTASARDPNNNPVTTSFLWVSSNPNVAVVDQNGLATGVADGTVSVTAAARGVPGNAALTVSVSGVQLAFTVQPTSTTAGAAVSPAVEVEVRDANGARVKGARIPVTLTLGNAGGATLFGSTTVNSVDGVATFSGLNVEKAGTGYTLNAASGSLAGASSSAFSIASAAAAQLAFAVQPGQTEGNTAIVPALQVQIRDRFGNLVTSATNEVTLRLATHPSGGTASGTVTAEAVGGVATFSNVRIDQPGSGYRLDAEAEGLVEATSAAFAVRLTFISIHAGGGPAELSNRSDPSAKGCGVTVSNSVYCWGVGSSGELGDGTFTPARSSPRLVQAPEGVTFGSVSVGSRHVCAVALAPMAGDVYCWGANFSGILGDGTHSNRSVPTRVLAPEGVVFAQVSVQGGRGSCALTPAPSGAVYCWGGNYPNEPTRVTPPEGVSSFVQLSVGENEGGYACALAAGSSGEVYCWGFGTSPTLVMAPAGVSFVQVDAGGGHTCALATTGEAYCWGNNSDGQLGDNTTDSRPEPMLVQGGLTFSSISAGARHTCAVQAATHASYCWGNNSAGQLGDGTTEQRLTPALVTGGRSFSSVSAGANQTCGLVTGANAGGYCWGGNASGQLGDGTNARRLAPTRTIQ